MLLLRLTCSPPVCGKGFDTEIGEVGMSMLDDDLVEFEAIVGGTVLITSLNLGVERDCDQLAFCFFF